MRNETKHNYVAQRLVTLYFNSTVTVAQEIFYEDTGFVIPANEHKEDALDLEDRHFLWQVYSLMFPDTQINEANLTHIICRDIFIYW